MTSGAGGTARGYEVLMWLMKLVIGEVQVVKIMWWVVGTSWGAGMVTITVVAPVVSDMG